MSDATTRARRVAYDLVDWNLVLAVLRAEGFSKIDSVRATVEVRQMPLQNAKRLVHESEVWSDVRERDETVLDEMTEEVRDLGAQILPPEDV